jgi:hypothetical protein
MMSGVKTVSVRDVRVVRRGLVVPFLVVIGGLAMVRSRMLVVFGSFAMVFR